MRARARQRRVPTLSLNPLRASVHPNSTRKLCEQLQLILLLPNKTTKRRGRRRRRHAAGQQSRLLRRCRRGLIDLQHARAKPCGEFWPPTCTVWVGGCLKKGERRPLDFDFGFGFGRAAKNYDWLSRRRSCICRLKKNSRAQAGWRACDCSLWFSMTGDDDHALFHKR